MSDQVFDPNALGQVGSSAAFTAAGFGFKAFLDWTISRYKARNEDKKLEIDSGDAVREDLRTIVNEQREEIRGLRLELADARKELRDFAAMHQRAIEDWQQKYNDLFMEVAELRASMQKQLLQYPLDKTGQYS